jgi:hypothetical protein
MPRQIQGSQRDFSAGEVDVTFKRNDDHPAHKAGLRQCANFRILNSNSVQNRSGRRALFPGSGRDEKILVVPGTFYFLCFGNATLTIRDINGAQVATNAGYAWTLATVGKIVYTQVPRAPGVIDVVMTFAGQVPKIARFTVGSGWTFLDFAFALSGINAIQEPFFRLSVPGATMVVFDAGNATPLAGDTVSLICSQPYFVAGAAPGGMIGSTIRVHAAQIKITAIADSQHATGLVVETVPITDSINVVNFVGYLTLGDIVVEQTTGVQAEVVTILSTANIYVQYMKTGQRFVLGAGAASLFGPSWAGGCTVAGSVSPGPSVIWDEEVMSGFAGWPKSCFFDQGRLGFTNFPALPRGIGWSQIGLYNNFFVGATPTAAMLELVPKNSQVLYVKGGQEGNEFVFCDNGLYYIPISVANPLKPGSVAFNLLSDDGCAAVEPRATQDVILYVNAGGNSMKAIQAVGAYQRPFNTVGLNEFHSHLLNNIVAIAVPRADAVFQERYIYVLNGDNTLAVGKYTTEMGQIKGIVGWVPFSGAGALQWVSAQGADAFFTTAYSPNGIGAVTVLEVLDDSQYLDCAIPVQSVPAPFVTGGKGPLFAFAGGSVALMDQVTRAMGIYQIDANGNIVPQFNGGENLLAPSLVAGQPWTAILEPFAPLAQPGTDMHQRVKMRQISLLAAYVINSTGFILASLFSSKQTKTSPPLGTVTNQRVVPAYNIDDDATLPPTLRETVETWPPPGSSYDPRVAIIKDSPGPLMIVEIAMEDSL